MTGGALVFIDCDDGRLCSIGLHYQGSAGTLGNAIPLWTIFKDFCSENLAYEEKLSVRFCSPDIKGIIVFNPTDF